MQPNDATAALIPDSKLLPSGVPAGAIAASGHVIPGTNICPVYTKDGKQFEIDVDLYKNTNGQTITFKESDLPPHIMLWPLMALINIGRQPMIAGGVLLAFSVITHKALTNPEQIATELLTGLRNNSTNGSSSALVGLADTNLHNTKKMQDFFAMNWGALGGVLYFSLMGRAIEEIRKITGSLFTCHKSWLANIAAFTAVISAASSAAYFANVFYSIARPEAEATDIMFVRKMTKLENPVDVMLASMGFGVLSFLLVIGSSKVLKHEIEKAAKEDSTGFFANLRQYSEQVTNAFWAGYANAQLAVRSDAGNRAGQLGNAIQYSGVMWQQPQQPPVGYGLNTEVEKQEHRV